METLLCSSVVPSLVGAHLMIIMLGAEVMMCWIRHLDFVCIVYTHRHATTSREGVLLCGAKNANNK